MCYYYNYSSTGKFNYSNKGLFRLVVDVDFSIAEYYCSLVPKFLHARKPKYPPHISVIREAARELSLPIPDLWMAYNGFDIEFEYSSYIMYDNVYMWLPVRRNRLCEIRTELGLSPMDWYTRPPDGEDCFHITIGNFK